MLLFFIYAALGVELFGKLGQCCIFWLHSHLILPVPASVSVLIIAWHFLFLGRRWLELIPRAIVNLERFLNECSLHLGCLGGVLDGDGVAAKLALLFFVKLPQMAVTAVYNYLFHERNAYRINSEAPWIRGRAGIGSVLKERTSDCSNLNVNNNVNY